MTTPSPWIILNNNDPNQVQRRVDAVASPTFVGNTIALIVPGHEIWHPLVIRTDITMSATVATRFPRLTYKFQNSITMPVPNGLSAVASSSYHLVFFPNMFATATEVVGATTTQIMYMPDVYLGPGDQVQMVVNQIAAGDTCTLFQVVNDVMFVDPEHAPPTPRVSLGSELTDLEHALELGRMSGLG